MHSNHLDSARFQFISPAHARYWASGTLVLDPQKKKKSVGTTVGMSALRPPPRSLSFPVCISALWEFTRRGAASSSKRKKKKGVGTTVGMSALRPPPRSLSFQVCTSALREFTRRGAASSSKRIQCATCKSSSRPCIVCC